jgi:hypothetical protein
MGRITPVPGGTAGSQRLDAFDLVSHLVRNVATAYLYRIGYGISSSYVLGLVRENFL